MEYAETLNRILQDRFRADHGLTGSYTGPEVLGLYRKREGARRLHEHGVFVRFRYNDLKEAARGCGGRGPYANSMV